MLSPKQLKQAERAALRQRETVAELNALVVDIDRCEKTVAGLKRELEEANARHPAPRSTREDVSYLSALLECAKKKLSWEKQIASVHKRAPLILENLTALLNDPQNPPAPQTRAEMLQALQAIQGAMERLQSVKIT